MIYIILGVYLFLINLLALVLTVYDKKAAIKNKQRIRERTLLVVAAMGGSFTMLITMRRIRHKTKHKQFMVGIPVIIVLQIAAALAVWIKCHGFF